ncbi:hypothetical protein MKX01_023414 [Papaver californicum]|nr:hypothetical protein MKX01_023414 [Papaver californicum]
MNGRKKKEFLVDIPESMAYLDTLKNGCCSYCCFFQGTVRMLSLEEWGEIQEVRPRIPFESKLARSNALINHFECSPSKTKHLSRLIIEVQKG